MMSRDEERMKYIKPYRRESPQFVVLIIQYFHCYKDVACTFFIIPESFL